ncbi:diguanylate cyclase/phosphodiesterase [Desulfocucumis palustris]|uniref:Diguanylate cyclase/phosphodiesterase n=1 Tax=Desulfocucumis palustris TaxID=1898651 RepID=A0A2L2XK94_9FIRM|nr:EAL domain-containing protein [Desulfocucumis palustris]GBF34716.1 diguanylate cyclase/phosphodiesterase [Desulfocucumis palustris]
MRLNSIKFIATALIFGLGMVTIFIFSYLTYINTMANLEEKYHKESALVLKHTLLSFQNQFESTEKVLNILAETGELKLINSAIDKQSLNSLLERFQKTVPNSRVMQICLKDGQVYMGPWMQIPPGYDPRKKEWYIQALQAKGAVVWSEPYLDYMTQRIIITAARQFTTPSGDIAGVLAIDFDVNTISNVISNSQIGENGFVMLLSRNGTVIANKDDYMIGERIFGADFQNLLNSKYNGELDYTIKNLQYHLKFDTIRRNGMILVTAISRAEINDNLFKAFFPVLSTGIACLFIFCVGAYFLTLKAIAPLKKLVSLMKLAQNGDYGVRSNIKAYDEINSLSNSFNSMIDSIRKRDKALKELNSELANTQEILKCNLNEMEQSQRILKASEERIKHLAYYDSLTGLSNRERLIKKLKQAIEENINTSGAVIYIDLDNFKKINDTMGHTVGDKVLIEVARRFNNTVDYENYTARIGGDEFIIFINGITSMDTVVEVADKLVKIFKEPLATDSKSFNLTASIGVALFPLHGSTAEEILKKADMAMYKAKEKGKNCYQVFDESMHAEIILKVNLENEMRQALKADQFTLYYQPQYNTPDKSIYGMEALLRWDSPSIDQGAPLDIIKAAEETGMIVDIEKWVMKNAFTFAREINAIADKDIKISVNISPVHIMQSDFVGNVWNSIIEAGVDPGFIGLEITETVMMESFASNKKKLEEIKKLGINIYLDDFGSGYSSLNYLQNLPIDYVKIDKIFVDNMLNSDRDGRITATIVELAHNIGLKVIAEGVEREEQYNFLNLYKCDIIQGYYMSKPVPRGEVLKLLKFTTNNCLEQYLTDW